MAIINGTPNFDILFGTGDDDEIIARGGSDIIFAGGGNDDIRAGAGNDLIFAGSGDDIVRGGNGNDLGFGGAGNDRMIGGRGSDTMFGGGGDDTFVFRADRNVGESDFYSGGSGNDRLVIRLNEEEAADEAIRADLDAFEAFLDDGGAGNFTFASLGLTVNGIERLVVREPEPPVENTAPVASDDQALIVLGSGGSPSTFVNVLANDTDADGDPLTITSVTSSTPGLLASIDDGGLVIEADDIGPGTYDVDYTISDGNGGTDTGTVSVTVEGPSGNTPPVANDDTAEILINFDGPPITFVDVLANDTDADGDTLSIISTTSSAPGLFASIDDGGLVIEANDIGPGTYDVEYEISDGNGGTDTATVSVFVDFLFPS